MFSFLFRAPLVQERQQQLAFWRSNETGRCKTAGNTADGLRCCRLAHVSRPWFGPSVHQKSMFPKSTSFCAHLIHILWFCAHCAHWAQFMPTVHTKSTLWTHCAHCANCEHSVYTVRIAIASSRALHVHLVQTVHTVHNQCTPCAHCALRMLSVASQEPGGV